MDKMPEGFTECLGCGFPVDYRGTRRRYCSPNCRVRALRIRLGQLTKEQAEVLARKERERVARAKCGLPPAPGDSSGSGKKVRRKA